jgi:hypothetical protein
LLVCVELEICHPENWGGKSADVAAGMDVAAGAAWAPSPAKAVARNTISTETILKNFMRTGRPATLCY